MQSLTSESYILFFSDHCKYCNQIIEELTRRGIHKKIAMASVELLKIQQKSIPKEIHSVPALVVLPSKDIYFGKQVFDYLFSITSGRANMLSSGSGSGASGGTGSGESGHENDVSHFKGAAEALKQGDVLPYTGGPAAYSDQFTYISENSFENHGNNHQISYGFATLNGGDILTSEAEPLPQSNSSSETTSKTSPNPFLDPVEPKMKKSLPDLDFVRRQRNEEDQRLGILPNAALTTTNSFAS